VNEDQELMKRTAHGDTAAFELLFRKWEKPIHAFLYRALGSRETAEDCTQETFVKLWRSAGRYRPVCKFSTYLFRIATNAMIDQRRRQARHQVTAAPLADCPGELSLESLPSPADDPHDQVSAKELDDRVQAAVGHLPLDQRTVFVLSHFCRLSYAEISDITQTRTGTVASRKFAAVRALRKKLAPSLGGLINEVQ